MNRFELEVPGITRAEYFQACRLNAKRLYTILGCSMVVLCGIITLATDNWSLKALLWPVGIFVFCVAAWEILYRASYKDQLAELNPPVRYDFTPKEWKVENNGVQNTVNWKGTTKLKKTKDCLFLYNNDASSSLLPRRLMSQQQIDLLEKWFRDSRADAKAFQKKELNRERAEFRANHPGLRLGRRGPAWGPFRKR